MDRLTALRVFVCVVEQGSLSRAGEKLEMSRAMVSRYLAELERWMGARLLHRTTRRLSLTGPGEEALNRARAMLELGEEMEQLAIRGDEAPKGQLRITSSYSLAEALLVQAANDYLARHPGTAIDILLLQATLDGAGISLQPRYSVQAHLASGALVSLLDDWQPKRLGVHAIYGTRKQMSPLLRSFLDLLVERMAGDPLWQGE